MVYGKMPNISPMLCTLVKDVPKDDNYLYEIKWDGYRIISYVESGKVRLNSRSGLDYTNKYPLIAKALKNLKHDVVIDGEVVVFNEQGDPDFNALQNYNGHNTPIQYCVFDLLFMDGKNLMYIPLIERRELLELLVEKHDLLFYSESFEDGAQLYQETLDKDLEGIVAKRKDSEYVPGQRGSAWLKIPTRKRQEFVIGGWAESEKGRAFRSLLFGVYEDGKLTWIGRSGGGFKDREMPGILKQLKTLETSKSPFHNKVLDTKGAIVHWVKPKLVANFEFATWTKTGRIRKPATFLGLRADKNPKEVVREVPKTIETLEASVQNDEHVPVYLNEGSNWEKVDESIIGKSKSTFEMEECDVDLHDVERELWQGVPKAELIIYYNSISSFILPHIKDRPQSLNLKLTSAGGPTTFIKDMENRQLPCSSIFSDERRVKKPGKRSQIDYLVCNNIETLVAMVDYGCVDINPWASRVMNPHYPDYIWLDLDPTVPKQRSDSKEEKGFQMAVEIALATKEFLAKNNIKSYIKTSGKTGLHIYIPCYGFDFKESRSIANAIGDEIHTLTPSLSTRKETISERGNAVYIDANQNDYADTLASPYSIRPYHEPLISTPLDWKEVKPGMNRYDYNIKSIHKRLEKKQDLFLDVLDMKNGELNEKTLRKFL